MSRSNADRIAAGRLLIETWRAEAGDPEDEANARDAIADILHAIAADGRDWEAEARLAVDNVTAEVDDEPGPGERCTIVCILPDGHAGSSRSPEE
jgi:hypothetical protein